MTVSCDYCGKPAELVAGDVIYPHREDLAAKKFWRCVPCKAWVGCHGGTETPLGRLANAELRAAKSRVHAVFDPLWKTKHWQTGCSRRIARRKGYAWLAGQLGIPFRRCHIGMFDVETCQRAIAICSEHQPGRRAA
jgi:hypothetical protein